MLRLVILLSLCLPLGAIVIQNDIPTVAFNLPLDEGSGSTPAYTGTGGSSTCTSSNLTWDTDPTTGLGNGSNAIIHCGPTLDLSSVTISACINPNSFGEGSSGYIFATQVDSGTPTLAFFVQDSGPHPASFGAFVLDTTGDDNTFDADNSMTVGDGWKNLIATLSGCGTLGAGCTSTLYLDGVPQSQVKSGTGTGTKRADAETHLMGWAFNTAHNWDGGLRLVQLYEAALNVFQVQFIAATPDCGGVVTPPSAVTETPCDTLMASYNALAGQADPFERTTGQFQNGDGCAPFQGVPTR
jgi:Concanavalin A-like lectin/glucanases superfamily